MSNKAVKLVVELFETFDSFVFSKKNDIQNYQTDGKVAYKLAYNQLFNMLAGPTDYKEFIVFKDPGKDHLYIYISVGGFEHKAGIDINVINKMSDEDLIKAVGNIHSWVYLTIANQWINSKAGQDD